MISKTRFVNEEERAQLFSAETIADGGSGTTSRRSAEGVRELEVFVVADAAHNFDAQLLVSPVEGGTLHNVRAADSSGGEDKLAFEETVLGLEYAVQITNNDGGGVSHDYDVYVVERT